MQEYRSKGWKKIIPAAVLTLGLLCCSQKPQEKIYTYRHYMDRNNNGLYDHCAVGTHKIKDNNDGTVSETKILSYADDLAREITKEEIMRTNPPRENEEIFFGDDKWPVRGKS